MNQPPDYGRHHAPAATEPWPAELRPGFQQPGGTAAWAPEAQHHPAQPIPEGDRAWRPDTRSWQQGPPRSPLSRTEPGPQPVVPQQRTAPAGDPGVLSADVRGAAVDRLVRANASHARLAAELRGTADALSAHALVLFSVERIQYPFQLSAAIRLDLEQEEGEDLAAMLTEITAHARSKITAAARAGGRWDPRTPLTGLTTTSETLTGQHQYIGVGISTLDRPEMSWYQARRSVQHGDGLTLPGHGLLYLRDGTMVHLARAAMLGPASGQHRIRANRAMRGSFTTTGDETLNLDRPGGTEQPVWRLLRELHDVLAGA